MDTYRVEPKVLIWAREECGLNPDEAAHKLERHLRAKDPVAKLAEIEDGKQPTLTLLQAMGKAYGVSLVTLFRPEPPPTSKKPTDFRTLRGKAPTLSIDTRLAIRSTKRWQETVADLAQEAPHLYQPSTLPTIKLTDDPENIAASERKRLGITVEAQHSWSDNRHAFRVWRWLIEELGILVFTFKLPMSDCRGFVLNGESGVPAIVVNSEDWDAAQTFTLFHEYAHVLLRQFGICGRDENVDELRTESFSNKFAAAFLMPRDDVIELAKLNSLSEHSPFNVVLDAIPVVAKYFKVSQEAELLRLEQIQQAPPGAYEKFVLQMPSFTRPPRRAREYHTRYLNQLGDKYLSVVITAFNENMINASQADYFLGGVKSRHFNALEVDLNMHKREYGTFSNIS